MLNETMNRQTLRQATLPETLSRLTPGNQVTLLKSGAAYFPAIEAAFDLARHEIYLESYIYGNDVTGQRIADALKRAVLRGVTVYLLIDGFGSKELPPSTLDRLRADGVKALVYRPRISPWSFQRKRLRRMHRKIVVVDRNIAFVGGINIVDDTEAKDALLLPRFDYAVAVEGPLVNVIHLAARRLWLMVAQKSLRKETVRRVTPIESSFAGGQMNAAFLVRDNFRHRRDIEAAYKRAFKQAKSEIILAHAYFLPGRDFRRALINAARRGVRVVLLLQGRMEYIIQHYASRALYGTFLDAGIEIYEYRKGFLHAKVAVIDGHWATVGSSNIDPFSLLLSREANVVVDDKEFSAILTQSLKQTIATDALQILSDSWKQQPVRLRFMSWLSYGLLRWMMGISGYAPENSWPEKTRTPVAEK
ncbi:MAG: cardiolipin synthase ClsB [Desulfuromonadales bacterium]|nr:cardiolipin synthase ClsB [Desulfuromonadales bacterium]